MSSPAMMPAGSSGKLAGGAVHLIVSLQHANVKVARDKMLIEFHGRARTAIRKDSRERDNDLSSRAPTTIVMCTLAIIVCDRCNTMTP